MNRAGPPSSAESGASLSTTSVSLTLIAPPSVSANLAGDIQEHSATLTGSVNPNGTNTVTWFDYGPTTNYGNQSTVSLLSGSYFANNVNAILGNLPTKAPVYYRLVAQNNAGITHGPPQSFAALTYGLNNSALAFDGADDRVEISRGGGLDGLTQGTIELWVYWNGVQPAEPLYGLHGPVFARFGTYGGQAVIALDNPNPNYAHVTWSPYSPTRALAGRRWVGDHVWHHVAVTFAPGAHRLYVDGVLEASGTQNGVMGSNSAGYVALANLANTATYARCALDEVRAWSMARNDIAYNMRRPLDSATPGLIAYWRLGRRQRLHGTRRDRPRLRRRAPIRPAVGAAHRHRGLWAVSRQPAGGKPVTADLDRTAQPAVCAAERV